MGIIKQLAHAFNAFTKVEQQRVQSWGDYGGTSGSYSVRPDRITTRLTSDRSVVLSIYNQIAIDVAAMQIQHVRLDPKTDAFTEIIKSKLNYCLTSRANIDETARAFKQNMVMSMFDKGVVAIVPVDTDTDPSSSNAYEIETMRVGEVVAWFPEHVRVLLYNDKNGKKEELTLPKTQVSIVENPMYSTMNETNATLKRLIRKLSLLDSMDEQASSGKLDLIIQLPYVVKSEARREQAAQRRADIESQLKGSQYGIAYTDGTEKITQLNRAAENNMHAYVESLTAQLYTQMGLTKEVFEGSGSEAVMLNYYNRTLEPILMAITQSMETTFLTKTARTQGQAIRWYRDPFRLVPVSTMGDLSDKFIRNKVFSSNEIRGFMGVRPSLDPGADKLENPNMPVDKQTTSSDTTTEKEGDLQNDRTESSA